MTDAFENLGERLRYKALKSEDAERLYSTFPRLGRDPEKFCPTCRTKKFYVWQDERFECDCQLQLQLNKHYLNAGIGDMYQRYSWTDLDNPAGEQLKSVAKAYLDQAEDFVQAGMGIVFLGPWGRGKSLVSNLILKSLLWRENTVYATTFTSMIEMFTAGWKSTEDKRHFDQKTKKVGVLLIDDLGKEMTTSINLGGSTLDDVLRHRVHFAQPTFITSNMSKHELAKGQYGGAIASLISESFHIIDLAYVEDTFDYRTSAGERKFQEIANGWTRPII